MSGNDLIELLTKVTQLLSGSVGLVTAIITLVTTLVKSGVTGQPLLPSATPGQPRPRLLSPKAILKGWLGFTLIFILGMVAVCAVCLWSIRGQPQLSEPEFRQLYEQFVVSKLGTAMLFGTTSLASAYGSYLAAKQARAFRLTYGFLAIGSFYVIVGAVIYAYFPEAVSTPVPAHWHTLEPLSVFLGSALGGIMGAED